MVDLNKEPDYEILIQTLIEKTYNGKLVWAETADENTYIAVVRGVQSFELRLVDLNSLEGMIIEKAIRRAAGEPNTIVLVARDKDGKQLYRFVAANPTSSAFDLFRLARRIASHVDERIDSSLELLNKL